MFVPRHETTRSRCPALLEQGQRWWHDVAPPFARTRCHCQRPAANRTLPPGLQLKSAPPPLKALTRLKSGRFLVLHCNILNYAASSTVPAATSFVRLKAPRPPWLRHSTTAPRGRDVGARRLQRSHRVGADDLDHPRARGGGVGVAGGRSRGFFRRLVLGLAGGVPRLLRRGRRRRRRDEGPDAPATVLRRGHRGQPAAHAPCTSATAR